MLNKKIKDFVNCALDPLVSPRCILHAAAETALYVDIGKCDCFVEGIGYLGSTMGGEETVAKFVQANLFTAWAHNSIGFLWCWALTAPTGKGNLLLTIGAK